MLLIGLVGAYYSDFPPEDPQILHLYVIVVSALAFAAGGYTLLPRMRKLIGLGILLGTAAASVWGLAYIADELSVEQFRNDMNFEAGAWIELVGHLILVLAACVAVVALRRYPAARLAPRLPQNTLEWIVIIIVGVHAVTLSIISLSSYYEIPYFVMWGVTAVLAFVIPACAASRQFGLSLLAGWIVGSLAIFSTNSYYLIVTGILQLILLALLVTALILSQTEVPS